MEIFKTLHFIQSVCALATALITNYNEIGTEL